MPINVATGVATLEFDSLDVPGRVPMRWNPRYSTGIGDDVTCPIGRGWFDLSFCSLRRVEGGYLHTTARGVLERFEDPDDVVAAGGVIRKLGAYLEVFRAGARYVVRSWDVETDDVRSLCFDIPADGASDLRLTAVEDVSGDGVDLVWEAAGGDARLVALRQRVERRELRFGYDAAGWIDRVSLRTPDGVERRVIAYEHDERGQLTGIVDAAGFADRFEYDDQGRVAREIGKDGGVFHYRYDDLGRCVQHAGLGHYNERRLRYMQPVGVTEVSDSYGNTTTYGYLPSGQVVYEVDPLGARRTTEYDDHGRTVATTGANGGTTRVAYDAAGNRTAITDARGGVTQLRFNGQHQPVELTDAAGHVWRIAYDDRGRIVGRLDPLGGRWLYHYDAAGNMVGVTNPLGAERRLTYADGVMRSITDWLGNATAFEFDPFGRVTQRTGPLGETTQLRYDAVGNLIQVSLPDGSVMAATFDSAGNMTRYVDAAGRTTAWRYGPCRRVLERTDPLGGIVRYVWGREPGYLSQLVNENGDVYGFERDRAGRIVAETSFDGARREFRYDAEGNISAFVSASGETVAVARDELGRVVSERLPDGEELRFCFDPIGNLLAAVSSDITVKFERDAVGRLVREVQGERWVTSRYDAAGRLVETQTSTGHAVTYRLDANGRPIELNVGAAVLTFERDSNGREVGRGLGGGARFEQRYDNRGRLIEQRLRAPGAGLDLPQARDPVSRRYSYDATGSVSRIVDGRWGTVDYVYDPAERLIAAFRTRGPSERFEYDSAGNLTRMQAHGDRARDEALVYGPGNRLLQKGSTRYEYDADGRRIRKIEDADGAVPRVWSYEWNALGRLKRVRRPDGEVWRYRYDALARRVGKERQGERSCDYLWDCDVIVQEIEADAAPRTWLWERETFVAMATVQRGVLYSVLSDHLGTPRELVSEHGYVSHAALLDSWGRSSQTADDDSAARLVCHIRLPGQWADAESGLCYNFFRYYDEECGRYISPDPIGLRGGSNEFRYRLNPNKFTDPFGLCGGAPKDGDHLPTGKALDAAADHLGPGYKEIAPGVFKSADGKRLVRMTDSDLAKAGNHAGAPHMNFETGTTVTKPNGKESFVSSENKHIFLPEEK